MDYTQAAAYLYEVSGLKNLKHPLEDLIGILKLFNSPQEELKIIHVAGTNGKGSTCAMLTGILTEAGYKVGMFTSPHLVKFNERITVNNEGINDCDFALLLGRVKTASEEYFGLKGKPLSFFEMLTLMAFIYFKEQNVDFAIMEAGMGGRLDSTNIITQPVLSVITNIGYDHMEILGESLVEIAGEKAGIIKKNCPAVLYLNNEEVYNVIEETACIQNSKLYYNKNLDLKILNAELDGMRFSISSDYFNYTEVSLGLIGRYQAENAAGVLLAVYALNEAGIAIDNETVINALKKVKWPGRMEVISHNPMILLDGAHNIDGAAVFAEAISVFSCKRIILVTGILKDKPYKEIIGRLSKCASVIIATQPESKRALTAAELADCVMDKGKEVLILENCYEAIDKAVEMASKDDIVCVTGSLYLIGALRGYLRREANA